jgi:CsoR family transcriptional regulator, copper-sensing transcriptional repressor
MAQNDKADLVKRLKRIEGQTRGVQKMVEENRPCEDILAQLNAINEAVRSVSMIMCERYAMECMGAPNRRSKSSRQAISAMISAIARAPR